MNMRSFLTTGRALPALLLILSVVSCTRVPAARLGAGAAPLAAGQVSAFDVNLTQLDAEITNFRGLFESVYRVDDDQWTVRQAIVFAKPDRLRVETLPLVGVTTLSLLVAQAGQAVMLDPGTKTAYRGRADEEFFLRFLRVPLKERDVMSFLLGRIPVSYRVGEDVATLRGDNSIFVKKGRWFTAELDGTSLLAKQIEIRDPFRDTVTLSIALTYEGVPPLDRGSTTSGNEDAHIQTPSAVTISIPRSSLVISNTVRSVKLNQPIPSQLFEVPVPSDYAQEDI